jgi:hypothetical protein
MLLDLGEWGVMSVADLWDWIFEEEVSGPSHECPEGLVAVTEELPDGSSYQSCIPPEWLCPEGMVQVGEETGEDGTRYIICDWPEGGAPDPTPREEPEVEDPTPEEPACGPGERYSPSLGRCYKLFTTSAQAQDNVVQDYEVEDPCPEGFSLVDGNCQPDEPSCPPGQTYSSSLGRCTPLFGRTEPKRPSRECPPGQVPVYYNKDGTPVCYKPDEIPGTTGYTAPSGPSPQDTGLRGRERDIETIYNLLRGRGHSVF